MADQTEERKASTRINYQCSCLDDPERGMFYDMQCPIHKDFFNPSLRVGDVRDVTVNTKIKIDDLILKQSPREKLLKDAIEAIMRSRSNMYGPPTQDFDRTATMWNEILNDGGVLKDGFKSHQVALAMIALKLSRLSWDPTNRDSWLDIAGYAGCGYECVVENEATNG